MRGLPLEGSGYRIKAPALVDYVHAVKKRAEILG